MVYFVQFPVPPHELLVNVLAYNPHWLIYCVGKAVIDTGAESSFIEENLARDLALTPTGARMVTRPGTGDADPLECLQVHLEVIVEGIQYKRITKSIDALVMEELDGDNSEVKLIFGMDFLSDIDMAYFSGTHGAAFMMSQTP